MTKIRPLNQRGVFHWHFFLALAVVIGVGYVAVQRIESTGSQPWVKQTQAAISQSEQRSQQASSTLDQALNAAGSSSFDDGSEQ